MKLRSWLLSRPWAPLLHPLTVGLSGRCLVWSGTPVELCPSSSLQCQTRDWCSFDTSAKSCCPGSSDSTLGTPVRSSQMRQGHSPRRSHRCLTHHLLILNLPHKNERTARQVLTYARLRFCPPGARVTHVRTPTTHITLKNRLSGTLETMSGNHGMFQKSKRPVWEGQERRGVSRDSGGRTG